MVWIKNWGCVGGVKWTVVSCALKIGASAACASKAWASQTFEKTGQPSRASPALKSTVWIVDTMLWNATSVKRYRDGCYRLKINAPSARLLFVKLVIGATPRIASNV